MPHSTGDRSGCSQARRWSVVSDEFRGGLARLEPCSDNRVQRCRIVLAGSLVSSHLHIDIPNGHCYLWRQTWTSGGLCLVTADSWHRSKQSACSRSDSSQFVLEACQHNAHRFRTQGQRTGNTVCESILTPTQWTIFETSRRKFWIHETQFSRDHFLVSIDFWLVAFFIEWKVSIAVKHEKKQSCSCTFTKSHKTRFNYKWYCPCHTWRCTQGTETLNLVGTFQKAEKVTTETRGDWSPIKWIRQATDTTVTSSSERKRWKQAKNLKCSITAFNNHKMAISVCGLMHNGVFFFFFSIFFFFFFFLIFF